MPEFISIDIIAGVVIALCVLAFIYFVFGREKYPYYARDALLTNTELRFYKTLTQICQRHYPDLGIAMQVRIADIINCSESDWLRGYGPRISAKHIDFVLFEKNTTEIFLCIELDDPSHDKADRKKRDKFVNQVLKAADVNLLRIMTKNMHNQSFILGQIKEFIE